MHRNRLAWLVCGLLAASAQLAPASVVTTLDGSQNWYPSDVRFTGAVGITGDQPRDGNGSLRLSTEQSIDKAGAGLFLPGSNPPATIGQPSLGSLGDLLVGSLSYEFYRDGSSTVANYLAPAFKLYVKNAAGETASLNYEVVYNDYPASSPIGADQWYTVNLLTENFWMRDHGVNRENYSLTLADYAAGASAATGSPILGNDTAITGIEVSIGSGWTGKFLGYVDNVNAAFGNGGATYNANFETTPVEAQAVPEPSTLISGGMASALGLAFAWKRRKAARA